MEAFAEVKSFDWISELPSCQIDGMKETIFTTKYLSDHLPLYRDSLIFSKPTW